MEFEGSMYQVKSDTIYVLSPIDVTLGRSAKKKIKGEGIRWLESDHVIGRGSDYSG